MSSSTPIVIECDSQWLDVQRYSLAALHHIVENKLSLYWDYKGMVRLIPAAILANVVQRVEEERAFKQRKGYPSSSNANFSRISIFQTVTSKYSGPAARVQHLTPLPPVPRQPQSTQPD